ncbi:MAG: rRNA pseudouridine synthase [Comamonas sp.]
MTDMNANDEIIRLSKRLAQQQGCSRREAELYIEGGWVSVDGKVVEVPGVRVAPQQQVVLAPGARAEELPPVTLILHKPAGYEAGLGGLGSPDASASGAHGSRSQGAPQALSLVQPGSLYTDGGPPLRLLQRHFRQLDCVTPLPTEAGGLVVYTQDWRVARKLTEDIETLEQECIVEVAGDIAEGGLQKLCHGLSFNGRPLPPIKVSWQSERRLRFALQGIRPGQVRSMCEAVGLSVVALKRIRIGRLPLSKMPEGQWRPLQPWERF